VSERQQILVPGIHVADKVTRRSCATLALLQTDSEADPPCLHAASLHVREPGAAPQPLRVKTRSPLSKPQSPSLGCPKSNSASYLWPSRPCAA